jgi:pyridoxine kinase
VKILSVQSWVTCGHVGNAAAMFPLQRLGAEVMAIHTTQLSNHPGHGAFTGSAIPPPEIGRLVDGLAAHGALANCDAVLSGWLARPETGQAVLRAVHLARPALWCCDPVMGDDGKLYVDPGLPEFFREQAVPEAGLLTPNQFELEVLTGQRVATAARALAAGQALRARMHAAGPRLVLISSLTTAETPPEAMDMMLCSAAGGLRLRTRRLPQSFNGAGDTLAALFLFHTLNGLAPEAASIRAASSVAGLLAATAAANSRELLTVEAQTAYTVPDLTVETEPM